MPEDLLSEDRAERKMSVHNLKVARDNQHKAHIRGNELFIEGKLYFYQRFFCKQITLRSNLNK